MHPFYHKWVTEEQCVSLEEAQKTVEEKKKEFPDGIPECGSDALRFSLLCYLT